MDETSKIYQFGGNGTLDPNLILAMNGGGGFGGGNFWSLLLILLIFGRDGLNRGGYNTDYIGSQLYSALQGNANAISNLSTQLNCSIGQVQSAIAAIQSSIQSVGAQNNLSFAQTINAIQAGDSALQGQISQCCCNITNSITSGFGNLAYENAAQFCQTRQAAADNTNRILAKIDAVQDEAKNNKINELTAALTAANSRAERQAELAPIYKQLNDIACKQPQTFTVPYQPFTAIPNCVAYGMGLYGAGYGTYAGGNGFL